MMKIDEITVALKKFGMMLARVADPDPLGSKAFCKD